MFMEMRANEVDLTESNIKILPAWSFCKAVINKLYLPDDLVEITNRSLYFGGIINELVIPDGVTRLPVASIRNVKNLYLGPNVKNISSGFGDSVFNIYCRKDSETSVSLQTHKKDCGGKYKIIEY